jgi:hypothetical protein
MKHRNRGKVVGLSLVLALAACADGADRMTAPHTAPSQASTEESQRGIFAERAALSGIGRLVAISLGDRQLRYRLKKDLRAAPFKEHKLELRRYLRSPEGKPLLRRMADAGARSPDAILTALDQIRPLELYMPVRKHRESWVGDGELLVATQLEGNDPIVAFNGRGQEIRLDAFGPPSQPTLSIVSAETRFDQPMPISAQNIEDRNGNSIGTLMPPGFKLAPIVSCGTCDGGGSGGGSPTANVPPGMYLEFSRILNAKEPWTRGSPEIEVHIQGPSDQGNPRVGEDLSCSGEHAFDYRKSFDQNDAFWEGRVMLFSADEINRFNARFNDGFHVLFWEDDDTPCVLKLDNEALIELIKATALATGTVALKVIPFTWRLAASLFVATLFTNPGEWLKTNDDFLGVAVVQQNAGYNYPNNTHVIMDGTTLNGRATILTR